MQDKNIQRKRFRLHWLFSSALLFWVIATEPEEFSFRDISYFGAIALMVLCAQHLFIFALWKTCTKVDWVRVSKHSRIVKFFENHFFDLLTTFFAAGNIYFFLLVILSSATSTKLLFGICLTVFFFLTTKLNGFRVFTIAFSGALFLVATVQYGSSVVASKKSMAALEKGLQERAEKIQIEDRRNIYLLLYDSLVSEVALRELFDSTEPVHLNALRAKGFRVYDSIAPYWLTLPSLARMIAQTGSAGETGQDRKRIISGSQPSLTYQTLRENGYQIQLVFESNFMLDGDRAVDFSSPQRLLIPGTCDFLARQYLYVACRYSFWAFVSSLIGRKTQLSGHEEYAALVLERLAIASRSASPWLTVAYIKPPRHTPLNFDGRNQDARKEYIAKYRHWLPGVTENVFSQVDLIRSQDPRGIVIVAGDHGAILTRGMNAQESSDYFLDRYGIAVAISPNDFCQDRLTPLSTTFTLFADIFSCLNSDKNLGDPQKSDQTLPPDLVGAMQAINRY